MASGQTDAFRRFEQVCLPLLVLHLTHGSVAGVAFLALSSLRVDAEAPPMVAAMIDDESIGSPSLARRGGSSAVCGMPASMLSDGSANAGCDVAHDDSVAVARVTSTSNSAASSPSMFARWRPTRLRHPPAGEGERSSARQSDVVRARKPRTRCDHGRNKSHGVRLPRLPRKVALCLPAPIMPPRPRARAPRSYDRTERCARARALRAHTRPRAPPSPRALSSASIAAESWQASQPVKAHPHAPSPFLGSLPA